MPHIILFINYLSKIMKYVSIFLYGKEGYMAVNLDMSKAYNKVEWAFIEKVMEKMGFHERWISLIMHCITIVSYFVLINGVAYGSIIPTRGLHQGDSLSSYLFLFCTDGFSSLINNAVQNQMMSGITISRGCPMITHLFFADDNLLLCKASVHECQQLIDIL